MGEPTTLEDAPTYEFAQCLVDYLVENYGVDVPDIVRCKDCKFNYGLANSCEFNPQDIVCTYWDTDGLDSNDFCSQAKRKDEVEND